MEDSANSAIMIIPIILFMGPKAVLKIIWDTRKRLSSFVVNNVLLRVAVQTAPRAPLRHSATFRMVIVDTVILARSFGTPRPTVTASARLRERPLACQLVPFLANLTRNALKIALIAALTGTAVERSFVANLIRNALTITFGAFAAP